MSHNRIMSDFNRTMFEHEGRIFHVKIDDTFPELYVNVHCCFGKRYRTYGYSSYTLDEFIKYVIAQRTAFVAAFLNDAMALLKKREAVIYLITPFGSLPFHFDWPSNDTGVLNSLIKLGDTSIAQIETNLIITYASEKQRNNAYDDVYEQCKRAFDVIKVASKEGDEIKAKQKAEQDAIDKVGNELAAKQKAERDALKAKQSAEVNAFNDATCELKAKQKAEWDAHYVKHFSDMSRTGYA